MRSNIKMTLLIEHTEWVLFQASISGIDIDSRLMRAVVEAKRTVFSIKRTELIDTAAKESMTTFLELGGQAELHRKKLINILTKCKIANLCYYLAFDAYWAASDNRLTIVPENYLRIGTLASKSPLAKWLKEHEIELGASSL